MDSQWERARTQAHKTAFVLLFSPSSLHAVSRLTHHTGYGNAAGLFAQKGILGMPLDRSNAPDYSSDSGPSSDSDEGEADIDVVTGTYVVGMALCARLAVCLWRTCVPCS